MGETYDETRALAAFADSVADGDREPVVVVAGCGQATTVARLREYDVAAYGFDTSRAALDAVDPSIREYVLEADLRDDDLVASLCEAFDVDAIDVFVTECMLSFLDVDEARAALDRIRNARVGALLHKVRLDAPVAAQEGDVDATIMPPSEWQAACDPDGEDVWRDAIERWELPTDEAHHSDEP